jgi:DNA-binding helix-hairpin-helix protein with protein kinase domain
VSITVGEHLHTHTAGVVRVTRLLGEGGQGWVWLVGTAAGDELALKWFKHASASPSQWAALQYMLERGSPDARFLWPQEVVGDPHRSAFGYLMPLRPARFLSLTHLATGRGADGEPLDVSFVAVVDLCTHLAKAFLQLHAEGLCYRDISLGNVFFDPRTGDVLVCDVDNVAVDDGTSRVLGTGRFMAPEIVRDRQGRTLPSTATDRHSLAVLLFIALFVEHPLEGARTSAGIVDDQHLRTHFGDGPLFNLNPHDDRNRPVSPHVVRYWELYPTQLRRLFVDAFTHGLDDPRARVTEGQWIRAFGRLRNVMGTCPGCAATVFYDAENPSATCWSCAQPLGVPLVVRHGKRRAVVGPHLRLTDPGDGAAVLGRGVRHPTDPKRFGLHNLTGQPWTATYPDDTTETVLPGQAVEVVEGLTVTAAGFSFGVAREPPAPPR